MGNELAVIESDMTNKGRCDIALALGKPPEDKSVSKYILGAMKEIEAKATLKSCSAQSIINCLIQCANLGLAVDNRHLAYLVPFGGVCTLMPGYLGYISKIKEADPTAFVTVGIVRQGDKFECAKESGHATYKHIPANPFDDSAANITGAYCHIKSANGSSLELMSKKELDKVRNSSKMKSGAIWTQWELEMIKKSVVRRASKLQFTEAVAKLNAIDDRLFEMSNKPQLVTLSPTKPMPEAIGHDSEPQAQEQTQEPESAPISEPTPEKAQQNDNAQTAAGGGELSFSGEVKMFMPQSGDILAGILVSGAWYHTDNAEVVALIENLKGQQVSGTYIVRKNGLHDVKIITTIGDAQ